MKKELSVNIYVGNISYDLSENELRDEFSKYGEVMSVKIITDRETNRPKGFGFVEMRRDEDGAKAIEELNGLMVNGRSLKVNEAKPKGDRSGGRPRW